MLTPLMLGFAMQSPAHAAQCDVHLKKAATSQGEALVKAFRDLAQCDKTTAERNFQTSFMTRATDSEVLTNLSLAAIDNQIWLPVWTMPGKIKSFEARDQVAGSIGSACTENDKVVTFLQGGYAGLKDIEFQQWDDALLACESDALNDWMTAQIEDPPDKIFDAKFNTLIDVFTRKHGPEALPHLTKGAIDAANSGGPYNTILQQMNAAVTPALGDISPENQESYRAALIEIARAVDPPRAREVAEQLASSGDEAAAASLLPTIYADRIQADQNFLYGVAAIETGECKGVQTALIHYAELYEPGQRWVILDEAQKPIRNAKPRLKKCTPEDGEWLVLVTPEPIASPREIQEWLSGLQKQWVGKGYEVSTRAEKPIAL